MEQNKDNVPPQEVLFSESTRLMEALVEKKAETGLNFCAEIGAGSPRRVVVLRQPVLAEKPVDWGKKDDGSGERQTKICRTATHVVITPMGPMSAEYIREVQQEGGEYARYVEEDGSITGRNEAGLDRFLQLAEETPPGGPFEGNDGFFPTVTGEIQLALAGPNYRRTLNPGVTPELFSQALALSIEAAKTPAPQINIEENLGATKQALDIVSSTSF